MRRVPSPPSTALVILFILAMAPAAHAGAEDPLEPVNRVTFGFNKAVDSLVLKPVASTYDRLAPRFVRQGIKNVFNNLDDVRVSLNFLAQGEVDEAARNLGRFVVNSTVGVAGLVDVAGNQLGVSKQRNDFGLTLAHYGLDSGPYLVLPFFGPSSVRDSIGLGFDSAVDPVVQANHISTRNTAAGMEAVDFRASLLGLDAFVIGDEYLFVRELYKQRREYAESPEISTLAFEAF